VHYYYISIDDKKRRERVGLGFLNEMNESYVEKIVSSIIYIIKK
jgi:hypothetical protein